MRWRPRFSLRTLVVFLLLVTSGFGLWWHWEAWYADGMYDGPAPDEFDREVAALAGSERFMSFLKERSKEAGGLSLAEVRKKCTGPGR